jgi:hypothetical protein
MHGMGSADAACVTDAERVCLQSLRELAGGPDTAMERHCLRVYQIACELGARRRLELDRELLLCAAWLHDAGLYPGAATSDAYVRDGRRLAERVLTGFEWPSERLQRLGDAIERHHDVRSQWRAGPEVELLRRADLVELSFGLVRFGLDRGWLRELFAQAPRDGMVGEIGRLVGVAARERPLTLPAIFLRPRRPPGARSDRL